MQALESIPGAPVAPDGSLLHGLRAGSLRVDPVAVGPRRGRTRRWRYAGAGDGHVQVGAAVVDLGPVQAAFAWAVVDGRTTTWSQRAPRSRRAWVGHLPSTGAGWRRGADVLLLDAEGGIHAVLGTASGPLIVDVSADARRTTPATLVTDTPDGGWNATEKAAGYAARGSVRVGDDGTDLAGGGWRDWTAGRQDRHTSWRWAAAAGQDGAGRAVGLNVSSGMNATGSGEDVLWLEGRPYGLPQVELGPSDGDPRGEWRIAGDGWQLDFTPHAVREADERLPLVRSRYVQPVGRLRGTLPDAGGGTLDVELTGVTEEHEATW